MGMDPLFTQHVATITVLSELGRSWSLRCRNLDLGLHLNLSRFNKVISPIKLGADVSNGLGHIPVNTRHGDSRDGTDP